VQDLVVGVDGESVLEDGEGLVGVSVSGIEGETTVRRKLKGQWLVADIITI
jgi:hypothetical protein